MKFSIYIGAAIDQALGAPDAQYNELKQIIAEVFGEGNFVIYSPFHAFTGADKTRSKNTNRYVTDINDEALIGADLAFFVWSNSPSFGVPYEIARCSEHQVPFVVWDKSGKAPGIYLQLAVDNAKLAFLATTVEEARLRLDQIKNTLHGSEKAIEPETQGPTANA